MTKAGYELISQPVQGFSINPGRWPGFLVNWRKSVKKATKLILENRPAAVLGLGGYAAGPAVVAGRRAGVPTAMLNPDLIPGRANRFITKHVDAVFCQWVESDRFFPESVERLALGCPIRSEFRRARREEGIAEFGLDPNRRTLLVTGASQGARNVNMAVPIAAANLDHHANRWQILHLTGEDKKTATQEAYTQISSAIPASCIGFTHRMADALAAADLVVSRAGASTLAELTALGRASILLPYPYHRDQHQLKNAQHLAAAGGARIVEDTREPNSTGRALAAVLNELLGSTQTIAAMSKAAAELGRPDAAKEIAVALCELCGLDKQIEPT
jgi:UDP-N-acetylglucosamine--N-acetylmuramyl-(pentapeptide) pyrophosphoryl-undecaprenol N-acetylglucosamine transferase